MRFVRRELIFTSTSLALPSESSRLAESGVWLGGALAARGIRPLLDRIPLILMSGLAARSRPSPLQLRFLGSGFKMRWNSLAWLAVLDALASAGSVRSHGVFTRRDVEICFKD